MLKIEMIEEEIPVYDITVEENNNFYANNILVHNCAEITLPSRPSVSLSEELYTDENDKKMIVKKTTAGEIALCNLSSYNLERYFYMTDDEREELFEVITRGLDNTVDLAVYPVKEGKNSNKMYRYLGIGVSNYTNYLALNEIVLDTQLALEETDKLFDDLSYGSIKASVKLAQEKGRFENFYETKWADGIVPVDLSNSKVNELTEYEHDKERWDKLSKDIIMYGIRNATIMAIAPTACQTKTSEIQTSDGVKSLEQIMDEQGIDHDFVEGHENQRWVKFKTSQKIPTRSGEKEVKRIWYNGIQPTRKITFEDGSSYEFTLNHQLLVRFDNGTEGWVYVSDLTTNMEIIQYE